ncbi:class F sortase [Demequina aestuarii]|uniref:class F sortase n=1 Tax=Demequina aestuarii TaxID=327095 RepID=UPI0007855650|nr:class F sortase [Demequina aestuarii]
MTPRTALSLAVACGLLTMGATAVAVEALQVDAPPPLAASPTAPSAAAPSPDPAAVTAPAVPAPASAAPEVEVEQRPAQALPVALTIPQIEVETDLEQLGTLDDGSLATPVDTDLAGWFAGGPRPGGVGPAVIAGHVSWNGDPSVFFRLTELETGDVFSVRQADGNELDFEVTRLEQHPKDEFPTVAVYANTDAPELRLITCGGEFDSSTGHFDDNVVVFAELVEG